MSIENEIAGLTQSTTDLLEAVNTKKATLDTAVSNAETAVVDATSQVSLAAAEKVGAQTARDTAESFKDQAYTYSQSAASAVAYQDLTAIAQTKVETAKDVFVYDTSKDSDGGAWRKRTQGTSWYNETLNTATRGSRKEFPAVAVIVALSDGDQIRIYDGDDPSLPMWMIITNTLGGAGHTGTKTSVSAINGKVVFGILVQQGLRGLDFVSDTIFGYKESVNAGASGVSPNPISLRNEVVDVNDWSKGYPALVSPDINDIAMTVLPDAPIDPATGLPIPTIAVATDGGVSVIKDDGTVVDITTDVNYSYVTNCIFYGERLAFVLSYQNTADDTYYHIVDIPSADINIQRLTPVSALNGEFYRSKAAIPKLPITPSFAGNLENTEITEKAIGSDYGFMPFDRFPENQEKGMIAYTTSTYNTGWMNGDIKLATLSDTDDTDLVGSELSSDTWAAPSGFDNTVTSISASAFSSVYNTSQNRVYVVVNTVVGETYALTATKTSGGNTTLYVREGSTGGGGTVIKESAGASDHSITFTATTITTSVLFVGAASDYAYEDISVRLAEEDRSVNNNGLQVFGTVQKNPVATGADLVAYSGFSSSNYLEQPYNPDLDFGTGDFCVMGWVKDWNSAHSSYGVYSKGGTSRIIIGKPSGSAQVFVYQIGRVNIRSTGSINSSGWSHISIIRNDNTIYFYINGKLDSSAPAGILNFSLAEESSYVGVDSVSLSQNLGSLSLLRISATAPTAEQIAKIYRDEKPLFQEGAQATLHGTSDAVTALAYDDTTELLHVGTSAGRSVFQGLRRVDNTTDAVGTAISASNGLVVEE